MTVVEEWPALPAWPLSGALVVAPELQTPSIAASSVGEDAGRTERSRFEAPSYRAPEDLAPSLAGSQMSAPAPHGR